mgnify:CR=1 FL=1|tara:strand:+ start:771 stop:989 length:219 start_codon:yes stop_codon:yes gene_type:complete
MKGQKASRVDLVEKKIKAIINVLQGMRDLSIGTLETLKLMEGYDKALEKLQDNIRKENEANEEEKKFEGLDD